MNEISESTRVPLFAVFIALPALVAVVAWLSTVDSKATAAHDHNEKQDLRIEKQTELLIEINGRVIRIEELLKHKER